MFTRRSSAIAAILAATILAGCGITPVGMEARDNARERLNLFNAQLSYDQAKQSFSTGNFERAQRDAEVAIALEPENSMYRVLVGRIFLETHRLEPALKSFLSAIEVNEEDHEAHYYAGIVFQRWSDDEQAYLHYLAASNLDPANVQYLLAAAEGLIAMGELDEARQLVEPKLEYFEHNGALHHLLGQILLLEGRTSKAAEHMTEARMLNPDDDQILAELARVQFEAKQYEACLQSLIELQAGVAEPLLEQQMMQARCYALLGRTVDARDLYQRMSQSHPSDPNVWIELGTIAWELEDYHRVAQCSVRAISLAPDRFEGYMLRGCNERHHGNLEQAVAELRKAVELAPDQTTPRLMLGLALEEMGDVAGAREAYEQALINDPGNRDARALIGRMESAEERVSSVTPES